MKDFDLNSTKGKFLLGVTALILIFCLASCIKVFVYDDATDMTHIISKDDLFMVISGSHSISTEEWERNIKVHNKSNIDEIESSTTGNEESISQ